MMITPRHALALRLQVRTTCAACRRTSEVNLQALVDRGRDDIPITESFECLGWSTHPEAGPTELCRGRRCQLSVAPIDVGPR